MKEHFSFEDNFIDVNEGAKRINQFCTNCCTYYNKESFHRSPNSHTKIMKSSSDKTLE